MGYHFLSNRLEKIIASIGKDMKQLIVMTSISATYSLVSPSNAEHNHDPIIPLSVYYREIYRGIVTGTPGDMHKKGYNNKLDRKQLKINLL